MNGEQPPKSNVEAEELYRQASPLTHSTPDDPPTLILHGTIDDTVPIAQADLLAERLKSQGVAYRFDRLDGWPHTMDAAEFFNQRCVRLITEFFDEHWGPRRDVE